MRKQRYLIGIIAILLFVSCQKDQIAPAIDKIKADVDYLCSPELKGRDIPGIYGDQTAEWIKKQFQEIGLEPVQGEDYLIKVPLIQAELDTFNTSIELGKDKYPWGNGSYQFPKKIGQYDLSVEAIWCVDGDFSSAKGKAALIQPSKRPAAFQAAAARRAGVEALVVVYQDSLKEVDQKLTEARKQSFGLVDLPDSEPDFPILFVNSNTDIPDGTKLRIHLRFKNYNKKAYGNNVVGTIGGSKSGYVALAAHYDHLGESDSLFYPGADDNASGIAGLLAISRKWSERKPDGRGLIVMAFTAEEDGMLGSKWFMNNLPIPPERISSAINMDMIGRNGFCSYRDVHNPEAVIDTNYAGIYFSAQSPELEAIINTANESVLLALDSKGINSFPFSDAGSFHDKQVPTIHLFSGYHTDYSSLNDTPDKLNYFKLYRIVNLVDQVLIELAHNDIGFDPEKRAASSGMNY